MVSTRKGDAIYLHVLKWTDNTVVIPGLPVKVLAASLLGGGKVTMSRNHNGGLVLTVAPEDQQAGATVIKLNIQGDATKLPVIRLQPQPE